MWDCIPLKMKANGRYRKPYRNKTVLLCSIILFSFLLLLVPAAGSWKTSPENLISPVRSIIHKGNHRCFCRAFSENFNYRHDHDFLSQLLKPKSSHPLSQQGFFKTRPRGIQAPEHVIKNLNLPGQLLKYPQLTDTYFRSKELLFISKTSGNNYKIRPPPFKLV